MRSALDTVSPSLRGQVALALVRALLFAARPQEAARLAGLPVPVHGHLHAFLDLARASRLDRVVLLSSAAVTMPIDERDIAAVAVSALLHDGHAGRSYTITGPEPLTQIDRVHQLADVLHHPLHFEEQDPGDFRQQMSTMPARITDSLLDLLASRVGATPEITDTVQQVTGRPPHTYRQWAAHHTSDFSPMS